MIENLRIIQGFHGWNGRYLWNLLIVLNVREKCCWQTLRNVNSNSWIHLSFWSENLNIRPFSMFINNFHINNILICCHYLIFVKNHEFSLFIIKSCCETPLCISDYSKAYFFYEGILIFCRKISLDMPVNERKPVDLWNVSLFSSETSFKSMQENTNQLCFYCVSISVLC